MSKSHQGPLARGKIPERKPPADLTREEKLRVAALDLAIKAAPFMYQGKREPITDKELLKDAEFLMKWLKGET